jgi:hypothetical protein
LLSVVGRVAIHGKKRKTGVTEKFRQPGREALTTAETLPGEKQQLRCLNSVKVTIKQVLDSLI